MTRARDELPAPAVVTVSYGSGEALRALLTSLRDLEGDGLEVIIVDNKPDDENVKDVAIRFGARYLPLPENPGYGAGMNAGVRLLERELGERLPDAYFFCNPDVTFIEPVVDTLLASLLEDSRAGSIGPRILEPDGTIYPSARNLPSFGTGVGHALFGRVWKNNPWSRAYKNAADYERRRPAGSLSGAAVMVKRSVYELIGGWDESYFMHFEDIDLGYRIGLAGFQNIYEPAVAVEHEGGHSTRKHSVVVEQAMTDSAIRFMRKRYSGAMRAPLRWLILLGLRVRGAVRVRSARRS